MNDPAGLRTTPLTAWHREHGAKMVPFAGFEMPVQYEGVLAEHACVREKVGLFDVTHMGEFFVRGPGAETWIDGLVTNRIAGIAGGKIVYTVMCRPDGGVLDDMLVYRLDETEWMIVCNASNHEKIGGWLEKHLPQDGVDLEDGSDRMALIAVQGPDSRELLCRLEALADRSADVEALGFYSSFTHARAQGRWVVSRTGYTGEHGYELYVPNEDAVAVWEELLARGADLGTAPIGLAARDTLRFEVCYSLYGHELAEDVTPLEAGIGWAVKLKKNDFVGRDALVAQKGDGVPRRIICLEITGRGIARQGARVLSGGGDVGVVTSGTFSPTLKKPLAMALVDASVSDGDLAVDVRGRSIACRIVSFPFLSARTKGDPRAERTLS
ncbi:MAG: glycine cleavage system aminomethyltransferase GcvT [Candidatus Krumholzibacteriota bacterium]